MDLLSQIQNFQATTEAENASDIAVLVSKVMFYLMIFTVVVAVFWVMRRRV